jgi:anaerobic magnesium-protoporphyrin IX monomethyl ester cyclase
MKILLIRPVDLKKKKKRPLETPLTHPPLGLLYIGAALEKDNHDVQILDFYAETISKKKLTGLVTDSDAVGLCVYSHEYRGAETLSKEIKTIDADIPVIIGGPHCILSQKDSLSSIPHADISVVGEGEHAVIDIIRHIQGKKKLSNIPGIYYKEKSVIRAGKPLKIIKDLDALPFPARHLVEKYDYGDFPFGFQLKKRVTAMITSRGCPYHCRFCSRYGNAIKGWSHRARSAESVVKELEIINERYRSLFIVDDSFLIDVKRAHKIFDKIIENKLSLDFYIEGVRVSSADKTLYAKMKKAGVKVLTFGIESGNQDVLDYYNKHITLQQIRDALKLARKMGFFTFGSFILGAPIETKTHLNNTINFACSLPLDIADFSPLYYMIGSQLWNDAVKEGKILKDEFGVIANSSRDLGNFTPEELKEYTREAVQRFYSRPSYMIKQFYNACMKMDLNLILKGWKFLPAIKKKWA